MKHNSNDNMDTSTINMFLLSIQNVFNDIRTDSFYKLLYTSADTSTYFGKSRLEADSSDRSLIG